MSSLLGISPTAPKSKWAVTTSASNLGVEHSAFLLAKEARYETGSDGQRLYKTKVHRSFHPIRHTRPLEKVVYSGITFPKMQNNAVPTRVRICEQKPGADAGNDFSSHVIRRIKLRMQCCGVVHELYNGSAAGEDDDSFEPTNWIARVNAFAGQVFRKVSLETVEATPHVLCETYTECTNLRKHGTGMEDVDAELIGKYSLPSEDDVLIDVSMKTGRYSLDSDLSFTRHEGNCLPVFLQPQGLDLVLHWERFENLFITSDEEGCGNPKPYVMDRDKGLRPLETTDLTVSVEVYCYRLDDAQVKEMRDLASSPTTGLNLKVTQPLPVGARLILLSQDPTVSREAMERAAQTLVPQGVEVDRGNFTSTQQSDRTYCIPVKSTARGHCLGYFATYQQLLHRERKNWLHYSGPEDVVHGGRVDPLEKLAMLSINGKPTPSDWIDAEIARTEAFSDHSTTRAFPSIFMYGFLHPEDWDAYDFDVSAPPSDEPRALWAVRHAATGSGLFRVWGLYEDKITFRKDTHTGQMLVRSSFIYA